MSSGATQTGATLVITDESGTDSLEISVEPETEIELEYTHSVEQTPVTDIYVVSDGALVSDRMLFSSFGAGLPAQAEVTREDDRYVYHPPEQRYDPLTVTTGPVAGHELVVDGERYDLVKFSDGGTVRIKIETEFRR